MAQQSASEDRSSWEKQSNDREKKIKKRKYFFQLLWCLNGTGREKGPFSYQCHWWKSAYNESPSLKQSRSLKAWGRSTATAAAAWCHGALAEQLESFAWLYQEPFSPLHKDDKSRKLEHPRHQQEVHWHMLIVNCLFTCQIHTLFMQEPKQEYILESEKNCWSQWYPSSQLRALRASTPQLLGRRFTPYFKLYWRGDDCQ